MTLTPSVRRRLSETIRDLRARLLADLHEAVVAEYRLTLPIARSGLSEAAAIKRGRLEAFLEEKVRAGRARDAAGKEAIRKRALEGAVKEAASTLLNRLVFVRRLEALGLSRPLVLTGGWRSQGFRELISFAPGLTIDSGDPAEGYPFLLKLLFDELALDLPGLFGEVGVSALVPVPLPTLRAVVEALDAPDLAPAWDDDTSLGWVFQYWNDPEREALDAKVLTGGKIAPHEIASKTQMFTERYMVEWLLQNSLGDLWLEICRKNGWKADAEEVFPALEERRAAWRTARARDEVPPTEPMAVSEGLEERWKWWVRKPAPEEVPAGTPPSIRDVKLLDPACGSGHFLLSAFDNLAALYQEEARHRGVVWSDRQIAEEILERNLFGVDIDPRAVQIAAAGLYLKARALERNARPRALNLVAPALGLASLPPGDPALAALRDELRTEAGIPHDLTDAVLTALSGVDHLGTLLKVDEAVEEAIRKAAGAPKVEAVQKKLFGGDPPAQAKLDYDAARASILEKIEGFLGRHRGEDDLGLRLDGEALAAGLRFLRIVKSGTYDVVVGNPPYQGASRMAEAGYLGRTYPRGKADLYAAFLERALDLARPGGLSALVTMRGWMFTAQYQALREHLLTTYDLRVLGDVDRGAFDEVPDEVVAAAMSVFRKAPPPGLPSVALQPTALTDKSRDRERTERKRAALLAQVGRYEFEVARLKVVAGEPLLYWWSEEFLKEYAEAPKLGDVAPARQGLATADNARFLRRPWECRMKPGPISRDVADAEAVSFGPWAPFVKGGEGRLWLEPLSDLVLWDRQGLELKTFTEFWYGSASRNIKNEDVYFRRGVAFSAIGNAFGARAHRAHSIIGHMGASSFPEDMPMAVCLMNSWTSRFVLASLNPGLHFEVGDVNRLPIFPVESSAEIFETLDAAFTEHEAARETSVEFKRPGPSAWTSAQAWAQEAVDRTKGSPLPPYEPVYEAASAFQHVSFAFGVAMGRFGANGEGILEVAPADALPGGILFLSEATGRDSLAHSACGPLHAAWADHGAAVGEGDDLRSWLRKSFFGFHRKGYEDRPIYFPLSSARKTFVAWVSIHRFGPDTLKAVLADHVQPELRTLEGELEDLKAARQASDRRERGRAEKRYAEIQKQLAELLDFVGALRQVAEKGPPPVDASTPPREADAPFEMDLDDGVMVNAAALWPLLAPQWGKPAQWWKELAKAEGKKDYDWAHLAARYFPSRVEKKCKDDPSLAVAHGSFWRLHPARAYAWELRLTDEIGPDFTIDEEGSDTARERFLAEEPERAADLRKKEQDRKRRKLLRTGGSSEELFDEEAEAEDAPAETEEADA
ncbi:MAG TPA: BREX-6 system adenine-specific DNA-methyltransferase PglX [Thermoanaerobaculia bacterium]|nr:BREX-6 system adenine-specific DNA-methyltransferase PglX [Thermoanaerobaculia bacterium]HQN07106.1 BREX-6 system adenine-specific DNA-methyltransferase PglX [Thermoanaerobaculia bacterium]HQP84823.1 BREX-6 system adenine-specific DNA-methyltransferase PglX [Thermoanaerobaculia bacterium]